MKAHMQLRAKIQLRERDNKLNEVSEQHLISPKTDLLKRSHKEIMETPNLCFFNSPSTRPQWTCQTRPYFFSKYASQSSRTKTIRYLKEKKNITELKKCSRQNIVAKPF